MSRTPILIIDNAHAGDHKSTELIHTAVLPLLSAHFFTGTKVEQTDAPGHAGVLAKDFIRSLPQGIRDVTLVLAGGDGTVHEVVNALARADVKKGEAVPAINLVLLPCGTANALYSSLFPPTQEVFTHHLLSNNTEPETADKLQSLISFLSKRAPRRLAIARTQLPSRDGEMDILSVVVTSTALHAAILTTAEKLRSTIPGLDRFKVAAEQNITQWYHGSVKLLPSTGQSVQLYDPSTKAFKDSDMTRLFGPFLYFLSTVNVDRLEPTFRITPMATDLPSHNTMDVLVVTPSRDPGFAGDTEKGREKFVETMVNVFKGAYNDGSHVQMRYPKHEEEEVDARDGLPLVEYYRCGGWVWTPDVIDIAAHTVCADGTLLEIERNGEATCSILEDSLGEHPAFGVWV